MNCVNLISQFLAECNITEESYSSALNKIIKNAQPISENFSNENGRNILINILIDTYRLNANNVKKCADKISKEFVAIGRSEKDLIKHYYDYHDQESFNELFLSLSETTIDKSSLKELVDCFIEDLSYEAISSFINNWSMAEKEDDETKKYDYLHGLYSRLNSILAPDILSLREIYLYNEKFIKEELSSRSINELYSYCSSEEKISSKQARQKFCDFYLSLLDNELASASANGELEAIMNKEYSKGTPFYDSVAEEFGLVIIDINQELYDSCASHDKFLNVVLSLIEQSYRLLKNHRTLVINIENIITSNGHNIKWELYSYIGIFAEHFIPTLEKRKFYKPEELSYAKCEYLGIADDKTESLFKSYYSGKISREELQKNFTIPVDSLLLDFENVWYGYTFSDCLSVVSKNDECNNELSFAKNNNHIVLIFNKYRHDDRRVPCPECAGLNISGNSFPEVGLRSWECKNTICPSRSKSNRGKRYSNRSNFMQRGFEDGKDIISRELIKKWRRDIVSISQPEEVVEMAIKYFSFTGDKVMIMNHKKSNDLYSRTIHTIDSTPITNMKIDDTKFDSYFNGGNYVSRFINQISYKDSTVDSLTTEKVKNGINAKLIQGDSRKVLSKTQENTFTAAVTSPPYYNARLYSQWPNLYLYLSDMYEITKQIYRTMKPGGIYLYNIGDICGNENTIVSSNMGNKRILLGAYTIYIFQQAGFELIDNFLWDKGEPQSNRQKNDGKFTPFYQKPMNVYEHMFIFKKPGANILQNPCAESIISENWKNNIVPFSPVIKINNKGENTLGHTAPFPEDIPDFVAKAFTANPEDIILEPFAGSGTSLIASYKNNRNCLGIELSEEYVHLIKQICDDANVPLDIL